MSGVAEPAMEYGSFSEEESMYFEPDPTLEVVAFLEKMLSVLTPLERKVVEMKYYGGFSVREISNILGLSENAIRKRRYNAFQKIRRQLEDDSSVPKFAQ